MAKAAEEIEALREATRSAHEALRDLRVERRSVQQLVDSIPGLVKTSVLELLEAAVAEEVAKLAKVTEKAMDDTVAKITREFGRLERILLGRESTGPDLEELARAFAARNRM